MKTPGCVALSVALLLSACAVGPDYHRSEVATPAAFKEADNWKLAEPGDDEARGNWWEVYGDGELDALVVQVAISNQNVLAAAAQYRQALALLGTAQAAYYPTMTAGLSGNRAQAAASSASGTSTATGSSSAIINTGRLSYNLGWEADIWGQIRRNVESTDASAQASNADLRSALLSAQATLVQTYVQLRANDAQQALLQETIAAYRRALQVTRNRYAAGVAGRVDVALAEMQLESTQSQAIDLGIQRAQYEHAIAVLIGRAPAEFQLLPVAGLPILPPVPLALPSALLERRPDIAAAERRMAAANAQIGVAQAAFFPALTLSSSGGYQNFDLANLLASPIRFWSVGAAVALTLFDGGAHTGTKGERARRL